MPSDEHLLRFLRARDFDVPKAREMIIASLMWRKQHNVDRILKQYTPCDILQQHVAGTWHHHDVCEANARCFYYKMHSIFQHNDRFLF